MTGERAVTVTHFEGESLSFREDTLVVEEPLEIRIVHGPVAKRMRQRLTITLRTPGNDIDLAMGLLFSEAIIGDAGDVLSVEPMQEPNVLRVELATHVEFDLEKLGRTFASTSSCGLCGKTMLDAIEADCDVIQSNLHVPLGIVHALPEKLRQSQTSFARTGGLHAAALFDGEGSLLSVREDVGRHNAVDKLLGAELRAARGVSNRLMLVSGRAGFELVQKAARFGVPIMVAVGAPTTLAVELAVRVGLTLLGFVRDGRGNCYAHPHRIVHSEPEA